MFASNSIGVKKHLKEYLLKLRYVRVFLTGDDLHGMGISAGPQMGHVLDLLRDARLDGEITTSKDEREVVRAFLERS